MRIKVIAKAWYDNTLYDPDVEGEKEIEYSGDKCPAWGEIVGDNKPLKTAGGEGNKGEGNKVKVKDLPVVEKNALLEAAKAVGIEGNQILSWNVDTLKAKIEAKKGEEQGNGEGEGGEGNKGEGQE